jgi:hypothetical protein
MPGDPSLVNGRSLEELVRAIVAEVLVISADEVTPGGSISSPRPSPEPISRPRSRPRSCARSRAEIARAMVSPGTK